MRNQVFEGYHDPDYLGDGVYSAHDGYHVWLFVEREGRVEKVALEPGVLKNFERYVERVRS